MKLQGLHQTKVAACLGTVSAPMFSSSWELKCFGSGHKKRKLVIARKLK